MRLETVVFSGLGPRAAAAPRIVWSDIFPLDKFLFVPSFFFPFPRSRAPLNIIAHRASSK